ncbi:MAG: class I SAM-dependent methyltransferase [Firmicutes bacterium]|nr:class I SAM-dependent methyltransferase [Bacillota bacterium]
MSRESSESLFNFIAPVYRLFYHTQKRQFSKVLRDAAAELDLTAYQTVLDVGCGTGALCAVLHSSGLKTTGVDTSQGMLHTAIRNPENRGVDFQITAAGKALPFPDKHFDISIASYVAHGMGQAERKRLYTEMSRVSRHKVIIYDYNQNRRPLTSLIEWLERGDYFRFIKTAETEMRDCLSEMGACFASVRVIGVGDHAAWYVCDPR